MKSFFRLNGSLFFIGSIPINISLLLFTLFTISGHAQVNAYAKVTAISTTSGRSELTISNINQTYHTFAAGDDVIIIQMQDNVIGGNTANNADFGKLSTIAATGLYEVATIGTITSTNMTLTSALRNTYTIGNNSSVQVVSFTNPGSGNYTTTANITAVPWNASLGTGGIVAFQVGGTLTLNHSIITDGQGFAGGNISDSGSVSCGTATLIYATTSTINAVKGNGIYMNTTGFTRGRAPLLTGGGGGSAHNGGGGGGGNFSTGGEGGPGFNCAAGPASGLGGIAIGTYMAAGTRLSMGGGGGGGQGNDNAQTPGANGGGIIIIKADTLTTGCSAAIVRISANGNNAISTSSQGNDGAGGAGAGGTIYLQVGHYNAPSACPLTIQANGGAGGNVSHRDEHGGGGGGGQGALIFQGYLPAANITATTLPGTGGLNGNLTSATRAGNGGGPDNAGIIVLSIVLPIRLIYFSAENKNKQVVLYWTSADDAGSSYHVQHAPDGIHFTNIGIIKGAGNNTAVMNYTFTDHSSRTGRNYYRLAITGDAAAKTAYSSIVSVDLSAAQNMPVAYPNPAHDHFNIAVNDISSNNNCMVTITDLTGRIIFTATCKPANNIITVVPVKPLKPGLYLFKITGESRGRTGKLMIQ